MMSKKVQIGQTYRLRYNYMDQMLEHGYGRPNHPIRGDLCLVVQLGNGGKSVTMKNLTRPEKADVVMVTSDLLQFADLVEEEPRWESPEA